MAGEEELETPFRAWLLAQRGLQINSFGMNPSKLPLDARISFVSWNAWAVEDELHEAMREVGWKPWATSRHFNREAFLQEIVDALHFIGNMVLAAGGDTETLADELWQLYQDKAEINAQRQREGYDGVSDKCPQCGRNLVDQLHHEDDNGFEMKRGCPVHGRVDA